MRTVQSAKLFSLWQTRLGLESVADSRRFTKIFSYKLTFSHDQEEQSDEILCSIILMAFPSYDDAKSKMKRLSKRSFLFMISQEANLIESYRKIRQVSGY